MALALLFALALSRAESPPAPLSTDPSAPALADAPKTDTAKADASAAEKPPTREEMEDAIPEGAPKDDYEFVAWCHGALAGQIELDPLVEKDMDAIEGKEKAAKRKAEDAEIAKQHRKYLALYEKALSAAEKASPTAIHDKGVAAELIGYKIWGPTRNKEPIWRMVDWGNWEVPPRCEKAAQRLFDNASLFGVALKSEDPPAASEPPKDAPVTDAPKAADALDPGKPTPPAPDADAKPQDDGLRGPK